MRKPSLLLIFLSALLCAQAWAQSEEPEKAPLDRSVEFGIDFASYSFRDAQGDYVHDDRLSDANGQFLRYRQGREDAYAWLVEIGRSQQFDETSFNFGSSYTRYLPRAWSVTVGLSSGTGDIIAPEYRLDLAVGHGFLAERNLVATLGYTRIRSKQENYSDGVGLEIVHYVLPHWTYSLTGRFDRGQPGDTDSFSAGASLTYYLYRRTYIGAGIDFGDVSYMLVDEGQVLVDFYSRSYSVYLTQWLTDDLGVHLSGSYTDTDDYRVKGASLSVFKEF